MAWGTTALIGSLLLAGGAAASADARSSRREKVRDSTQSLIQQQLRDQREYQENQDELVDQGLDESNAGRDATEDAMRQRAREIAEALNRNRQSAADSDEDPEYESSAFENSEAGSRVFQGALQRRAAEREAEGEQRRQTFAELRSLGDVLSQNRIERAPIMDRINLQQEFARMRADDLPLEVDAARADAADHKRGQQILGTVGQAVGAGMIGQGAYAGAVGGGAAGGGGSAGATTAAGSAGYNPAASAATATGAGAGSTSVNPMLISSFLNSDMGRRTRSAYY